MFKKISPIDKELKKLYKKEQSLINKKLNKKSSKLDEFLSDKVPQGLQKTLNTAFTKAFNTIFSKGTGVIEKTYNKGKIDDNYKINSYIADIKNNRKSLKTFNKSSSDKINLAISGVSGVSLGVLGIGLPDIALFTAIMLKSIYQISLNYGYDYNTQEEKHFILLLIQGALSTGEDFEKADKEVEFFIKNGYTQQYISVEDNISKTANCLSGELLYMKFLQGVPIVGAVGGAYDFVYTKQVLDYAKIKYYKRFLINRKKNNEIISNCL